MSENKTNVTLIAIYNCLNQISVNGQQNLINLANSITALAQLIDLEKTPSDSIEKSDSQ